MIKDYMKITDMSALYNDWRAQASCFVFDDTGKQRAWEARIFELDCLLAIAQQVSIVATHLGKITRKAEELNGKN